MDSLATTLMQVEEQLRQERVRNRMMEDKVRQMEVDVEAIPILKAQVEVSESCRVTKGVSFCGTHFLRFLDTTEMKTGDTLL